MLHHDTHLEVAINRVKFHDLRQIVFKRFKQEMAVKQKIASCVSNNYLIKNSVLEMTSLISFEKAINSVSTVSIF